MVYFVWLFVFTLTNQVSSVICTLDVPLTSVTFATLFNVNVLTDQADNTILFLKVVKGSVIYRSSVASSGGNSAFSLSLPTIGNWEISASCDNEVSYTLPTGLTATSLRNEGSFTETVIHMQPITINRNYRVDFNVLTTNSLPLSTSSSLSCGSLAITDDFGGSLSSFVEVQSIASSEGKNICAFDIKFTKHLFYKLTLTISENTSGTVLDPCFVNAVLDKIFSTTIDPTTKPSDAFAFAFVTYKVNIGDGIGTPFTGVASVILITSDTSTLGGTTYGVVQTGIISLQVFFKIAGSFILSATASTSETNKFTDSYTITIRPLKFVMTALKSDNSVPSTSNDEFTIEIKVLNQDGTTASSNLPQISFELKLTSSGVKSSGQVLNYNSVTFSSGQVTGIINNGIISTSGCKILSSGTFNLGVSTSLSPTIESASITSITIINFISLIVPVNEAITASTYFKFTLSGTVQGSDSLPYLSSVKVSLADITTGGSNIKGELSAIITSGLFTFNNIYFMTSGEKTITISNDLNLISALKVITVNLSKLKLSLSAPMPFTSDDQFTVTVTVRDSSDSKTEMINNPHSIQLSLNAIGSVSGTLLSPSLPTSSTDNTGVAIFSNIKIFSSGIFKLKATSPNFEDGLSSSTLAITNFIKIVNFDSEPVNIVTYTFFVLKATIIGTDDMPYIQKVDIDLTETTNPSSNSLEGTKKLTSITNGLIIFNNIYFTTPGTKTITLKTTPGNIVENKVVTVALNTKPLAVKFTTSSSAYYINQTVSLNVTVINLESNEIENSFGIYSINLLVSPTVALDQKVVKTSAGVASVQVRLRYPGIYIISGEPESKFAMIPAPPLLIMEQISVIKYDPSQLYNYKNTRMMLNLTLLNYYEDLYNYTTSLTFTCINSSDVIIDNSIVYTSKGVAIFYLYFLSGGSKECNIKSTNDTSKNIIFTINPESLNNDKKCVVTLTNDSCYECMPQTVLKSGKCYCAPFSTLNTNTEKCDCIDELSYHNGICTACGNYFNNEELSAHFTKDYKGIIIEFARPVNQANIGLCNKAVILPDIYKNYTFSCVWVNLNTMEIEFNRVISGVNSPTLKIQIDPRYIQAVGRLCFYNITSLIVNVIEIYSKPVPQASIEGPSTISIKCNQGLILKSKYIKFDYVYFWSVESNSMDIIKYIAQANFSSILSIPQSLLVPGTLKFTLTILSAFFQTKSFANLSVQVSNDQQLLVGIPIGTSITSFSYDPLVLKVSILHTCGSTSKFFYFWKCTAVPTDNSFDLEKMTNSKEISSSSLTISQGALKKNTNYNFTVTVISDNINGTASVIVSVIPHDLLISLNRVSGTISILQDLLLLATVVDPDNECTSISIVWSCTESNNQCTDAAGNTIVTVGKPTLLIAKEKLKSGAYYSFKATASCNIKVKAVSKTIDIHVSVESTGSIEFSDIEPISSDKTVTIIPTYTAFATSHFQWTIQPSVAGVQLTKPFLYIPQKLLTPKTSYQINLAMFTTSPSDGVTANMNLEVKPVPICASMAIQSTGNMTYRYFIGNCENDVPYNIFTFTYGYIKDNGITWLTGRLYENSKLIKINDFEKYGAIKVCSQLSTCYIYMMPLVALGRNLEFETGEYELDTYDPDLIPAALIYYSNLTSDSANYEYLYEKYMEYFRKIKIDESSIDAYLDTTIAMLNNSYALENDVVSQSHSITLLLIEVLQNFTTVFSDEHVLKIFRIVSIGIENRDPLTVLQILELVSTNKIRPMPIDNYIFYYDQNLTVFRYKSDGAGFAHLLLSIEFADFLLNKTTVYELLYAKFVQIDLNFKLLFFETGNYESFNYHPNQNATIQNFKLSESTYLAISGAYDPDKEYKCFYQEGVDWISDSGCIVDSVNNSFIKVKIDQPSTYRIKQYTISCGQGLGPVVTMATLIFIMIGLSILFIVIDKDIQRWPSVHNILLYYPLSCLFYPQPNFRRAIISLQIITSEVLLLTIIGALYFYFDSPEAKTNNNFHNYYGRQIIRGSVAWVLTLIFKIPMFTLNVWMVKKNRMELVSFSLMTTVTIGCVFGIIYMTFKYCSGWTEYWIANFLIFMLIDLVSVELFLAILLSHFVKIEEKQKHEFKFVKDSAKRA